MLFKGPAERSVLGRYGMGMGLEDGWTGRDPGIMGLGGGMVRVRGKPLTWADLPRLVRHATRIPSFSFWWEGVTV